MRQNSPHKHAEGEVLRAAPLPRQGAQPDVEHTAAPHTALDGLVLPSRDGLSSLEGEHVPTKESKDTGSVPVPTVRARDIAKTAITSSAVWSGAGASVVCLDSSLIGVLGHGLSTLWTLRNELRQKAGAAEKTAPSAERVGRGGYLGLALDALYSPGFNKIAAGLTYLGAGIEAGVRGRALESAVFAGYCMGCMAVVAVLNQSYSGTRTTSTLSERAFKTAWGALPARVQTFLKDPGVYMTLGNGSLVVGTMNLENLTSNPLPTVVLGVGLALSSLGLAQSVVNFCRGAESPKAQAGSVYLNGAANGLFGVASFMQGSPVVGAAKLCWAVSCGLLARMIAPGVKRM